MKKRILGLLSTVAAVAALGFPCKSNLGGDGMENCDAPESTAQLYIQDGLVAMWDGIENVGWGLHSANTLVWKDLVGNLDLFYTGSLGVKVGYWENDCFRAVSKGRYAWVNEPSQEIVDILLSNSPMTIEGAFSIEDEGSNNSVLLNISDCSQTDGMMFCAYNSYRMMFSLNDRWSNQRLTLRPGSDYDFAGKKIFSSCVYGNGAIVAKMTVDGEESKTAQGSAMGITKTPTKLALGNYCWTTIDSRAATGKYNCFRIYNRALSVDEIEYNSMVDRMRFGENQ